MAASRQVILSEQSSVEERPVVKHLETELGLQGETGVGCKGTESVSAGEALAEEGREVWRESPGLGEGSVGGCPQQTLPCCVVSAWDEAERAGLSLTAVGLSLAEEGNRPAPAKAVVSWCYRMVRLSAPPVLVLSQHPVLVLSSWWQCSSHAFQAHGCARLAAAY